MWSLQHCSYDKQTKQNRTTARCCFIWWYGWLRWTMLGLVLGRCASSDSLKNSRFSPTTSPAERGTPGRPEQYPLEDTEQISHDRESRSIAIDLAPPDPTSQRSLTFLQDISPPTIYLDLDTPKDLPRSHTSKFQKFWEKMNGATPAVCVFHTQTHTEHERES